MTQEEQKVIEAKMRMQFESQNEKNISLPDQSHLINSEVQSPASTNAEQSGDGKLHSLFFQIREKNHVFSKITMHLILYDQLMEAM